VRPPDAFRATTYNLPTRPKAFAMRSYQKTIYPPVGQAKPATLPGGGDLGSMLNPCSAFARVLIVLGSDGSRPLPRRI
jgi:hypothetical protein